MGTPYRRYTSMPARVAVCLAGACIVLLARNTPVLRAFEYRMYDLRATLAAFGTAASDEIVILAIDDRSLERLEPAVGRWPWPRAVFAGVLDFCAGAQVVAMDLIFPEADWQFGSDDLFADAVKRHGRVVSAIHFSERPTPDSGFAEVTSAALPASAEPLRPGPQYRTVLVPYPALREASAALGHVNYTPDEDGVVREYDIVLSAGGTRYPSLALATTRLLEDTPPPIEAERLAFCAAGERFRTYSIVDILESWRAGGGADEGGIPRADVDGKIVLIGSVATGIEGADRKVTSLSTLTPGVEITATAIDNLLNQTRFLRAPALVGVLLTLVLSVGPGLLRLEQPVAMVISRATLITLYATAAMAAAVLLHVMLPVTAPLLGLLVSSAAVETLYWAEERARRKHLEHLEAMKQQFTDMLVHDMRGRTSSITLSMSQLEKDFSDANTKTKRLMAAAQMSSKWLLTQMNALLDIRKMQEGKMKLSMSPVHLPRALDNLIRDYVPSAELMGLQLEVRVEQVEVPDAEIDMNIFSRLVENLIWNALQHAPAATTVEVGCTPGPNGSTVEVAVSNHGEAIPEEEQMAIFQAFVTGRGARKNLNLTSTGLGLAFCRLAAEAHGGSIHLDSPCFDDGDGVRIRVRFPCAVSTPS